MLTQKEIQAVKLLADGHNVRGIADQMGIAYGTARMHLTNARLKSGTHHQPGLIAWWLKYRGQYE
jgi:DNA-binding CsgD family transcriptional regulator